MPTISDSVAASTRSTTREGFLRAGATVTRPGVVTYDAADLGVGARGEKVTLRRTEDSVFHAETMDSLSRAPVTLGHPEEGNVVPGNFGRSVVGSVVGEPHRTVDDHLAADVILADERALAAERAGQQEMSIRYSFDLEDDETGEADFRTEGPLRINHVALVKSGRAGSTVSLQDENNDGASMTTQDIEALAKLLSEAGKKQAEGSDAAEEGAEDVWAPFRERLDALLTAAETAQVEAEAEDSAEDLVKAAEKEQMDSIVRKLAILGAEQLVEGLGKDEAELLDFELDKAGVEAQDGWSPDYKRARLDAAREAGPSGKRPQPATTVKLKSEASDAARTFAGPFKSLTDSTAAYRKFKHDLEQAWKRPEDREEMR